MDIQQIVSDLGVPVAVAGAAMWFIYKQTQFIQNYLMGELGEGFARLEKIIITLINQQKELQSDTKESLADMRSSYQSLVEIIQSLTGNGLKKRKDKYD